MTWSAAIDHVPDHVAKGGVVRLPKGKPTTHPSHATAANSVRPGATDHVGGQHSAPVGMSTKPEHPALLDWFNGEVEQHRNQPGSEW